jgi:hypothetical protein
LVNSRFHFVARSYALHAPTALSTSRASPASPCCRRLSALEPSIAAAFGRLALPADLGLPIRTGGRNAGT